MKITPREKRRHAGTTRSLISKRLSEISCDEDAFNETAPHYQEALRKSGYAYTLKFKPEQQRPPNQKKEDT